MRSRSIIIGIFLSVILGAVAAGLYWQAGKIQPANHRLSISLIQRINQLESQWSIETARVRSDPGSDFDALIDFIPRMERLKKNLSETMLGIPDLPENLHNTLSAYQSAINAKEERTERFKTGYAILRNSVRYLPLAAASVMRQVRERGGDPAFIRNISTVTDEINTYLTTPAPPEKERLVRVLEDLGDGLVARYPFLANPIANFVAHGQVLLDRQEPTEAFFQDAVSNSIVDFGEDLISGLESEIDRKETLVSNYQRGVLASGGGLWLVWLFIALRMPKNDRQQEEAAAVAFQFPRSVRRASPQQDTGLADLTTSLLGDASPATENVSRRIGLEVMATQLTTFVEQINGNLDSLDKMQGQPHDAFALTPDLNTLPESGDGNEPDDEPDEEAPGAGVDEGIQTAAAAAVVASLRAQTHSIIEVADRLPSFSEGEDDLPTQLDINDAIEEIVEKTQTEEAIVAKELNPVPTVLASEAEISLLLTNVIENSVQAVQDRGNKDGVIRIETRQEDGKVLIIITDNGAGIAPKHLKKVFTPFYTSRDDALGMGLTTTQHVVHKYGGSIALNSLPNRGTMVRIALPAGAGM